MYYNDNYLQHYGVLGMKWGVRRYQNKDGSLTKAGKKRISKEYKNLSVKAMDKLNSRATEMYVESYNKAADYMNNGGIDKFNARQKKKYGKNYAKRDGYDEDMFKLVDKRITKYMNRSINDFYNNDEDMLKAKALAKKYNMTSWDELAKNNADKIEEVRRAVEKNR